MVTVAVTVTVTPPTRAVPVSVDAFDPVLQVTNVCACRVGNKKVIRINPRSNSLQYFGKI